MTDLKNMMSDSELDTVVGGKFTALVFKANEKGMHKIIETNAEGDITKINDIIAGGSAKNLYFNGSFGTKSVPGNILEKYLEILKSRHNDINIVMVDKED